MAPCHTVTMERKSTGRLRTGSRFMPASKRDLAQMENRIMAALDDLTAEVEENTSVVASAVTLLKGLKEKLDAAGTDPVKLKALSNQLDTQNKALAEAVAANTPAENT